MGAMKTARLLMIASAMVLMALPAKAQKGPDWTDKLPVAPGTSLREEEKGSTSLKITLETVTDVRDGQNYVWVAGTKTEQNPASNEVPVVRNIEATVTMSAEKGWAVDSAAQGTECKELLHNRKPVALTGNGMFKQVKIGERSIDIYRIDEIISCSTQGKS